MGAVALFLLVAGAVTYLWALNRPRKSETFPAEDYPRGVWLAEKVAEALLAKDQGVFLEALKDLRLAGSDGELTLRAASQRLSPRLMVFLLARYCWWCWPGLPEMMLTEEATFAARQLIGEYKNKAVRESVINALCQECKYGEAIELAVRRLGYLTPEQKAWNDKESCWYEEAINH